MRGMLPAEAHTCSTSESGKILVAILKPPDTVACNNSSIDFTSLSTAMLPIPHPMSVMAEERRAALGRVIFGALTAPICTNRMHRVFSRLGPGGDDPFGALPPQVIQDNIDSIAAELLP